MITNETLDKTRKEIFEEINNESHNGNVYSHIFAEGIDQKAVQDWISDDMDMFAALSGHEMDPRAAMFVGLQLGVRMGRNGD